MKNPLLLGDATATMQHAPEASLESPLLFFGDECAGWRAERGRNPARSLSGGVLMPMRNSVG